MRVIRASTNAGRHRTWHRSLSLPLLSLFSVLLMSCLTANTADLRARELQEARAAFDANLRALRERNLEAYLAGYLDSPDFAYLGPEGLSRGFAQFAAEWRTQRDFPDSLVAGEPDLTWLAPGVVHVAYPFAARQGDVTGSGWSERILVHTQDGWRIAVTTVIPAVRDDDGR